MDRRKTSNILWLAFQYAKQDREALIAAYRGDELEKPVKDALGDIKALKRLQERIFGTTESEIQCRLNGSETILLSDIIAQLEEEL